MMTTTEHGGINEVGRENLEAGEHVELEVGDRRLHVTETEDCTSVVLADPGERQASVVVEDGEWETREK